MRPAKMIACHYRSSGSRCSGRGKAACFVTDEAAQDLLETQQAQWGNSKQSYLVFTKIEAQLPVAAESLRMGPSVMNAFVAGSARHVAMVMAWRPMMQAAQ